MKFFFLSTLVLLLALNLAACDAGQKGSAQLQKDAATFIDLLTIGKFKDAVKTFDPTMEKLVKPKFLKQIWQSLLVKFGAYHQQEPAGVLPHGKMNTVFIKCYFARLAVTLKVTYDQQSRIAGFHYVPPPPSTAYKPPAYVDTNSFTESEVAVGEKGWPLPGTFTIPKKKGVFPVIILVHGSGPNDRDESVGPNKPFRDLAWGLASRGIAVLRYEKRTKAHGAKMDVKTATVAEETLLDAVAAVQFVRTNEKTDSGKIYILGHSLGGMLVPRIAKLDTKKNIAGFIVMAGPARPLEQLILDQTNYLLAGSQPEVIKKLEKQVAQVTSPNLSLETPMEDLPLSIPAAYWLDLRGYQPAQSSLNIKQPILIMQGKRDYQVTEKDFNIWQKTLSTKKNVTFKLFSTLNHLFIAGEGASVPAEYQKGGHVAAEVIETITTWLKGL